MVSDIGVDAVGKINGGCPDGKLFDGPLWREDVDLVREEVHLDALDKFCIIL